MKAAEKNQRAPEMMSIRVDEAANGGHNSRCGLLARTHCAFLTLERFDPRLGRRYKRKNEKEVQ